MKFSAFIAAILLTVSLIACGGENGDDMNGDTAATGDTMPPPPPPPPPPAPDTNMSDTTGDTAAH